MAISDYTKFSEEYMHTAELMEKPVITDKDIIEYDWDSHTVTIGSDAVTRISGIVKSFIVVADGKRCYAGCFWSFAFSQSIPLPIIDCLDAKDGTFRIQASYPTDKVILNYDPRIDKRVKNALEALGKLKVTNAKNNTNTETEPDRVKEKGTEFNDATPSLTDGDPKSDASKSETVDWWKYIREEWSIPDRGEITINEKMSSYDFMKLKNKDVSTFTKLFHELYKLDSKEKISVYDKEIELEVYDNKYDEKAVLGRILVVKSGDYELQIPLSGKFLHLNKLYIIPKTKEKMLCISNESGGNAWNSHPKYVISLEDKYFLKNLGEVSGVSDIDNDGLDELYGCEDIWESGLGGLGISHVDAPCVRIILRIDEDKIVSDIENNYDYYYNKIESINNQLQSSARRSIPVLSRCLEKFLLYRLLGNIDKAWDELNKDMIPYGNSYTVNRKRKITVEEIKNKMRISLKKRAADLNPRFIFVVALERETPDETQNKWSPTLYKINLKDGSIVDTLTLFDHGYPRQCIPISDDSLKVIIIEGVFANGTFVLGIPYSKIVIIDKNNMSIENIKIERGSKDNPMEAVNKYPEIPEEKRAENVIPKNYQKKDREMYLHKNTKISKTFVLTRDSQRRRTVKILDSHSYNELESIPLNHGDRKLGWFNGFKYGDVQLFDDRYLVLLFHGENPVGHFAPGYVVIVDIISKNIKYVEIGSDPASGIAY